MKLRRQAVVSTLIVIAFAGCVTREQLSRTTENSWLGAGARVKYAEPGFTRAHLIEGKLAFGAVSGLGDDDFDLAANVSQLLARELAIKVPALSITPLEDVRCLVGTQAHQVLIAEVGEKEGPEAGDFVLLHAASVTARYAVWIHLTGLDLNSFEWQDEVVSTTTSYNCETKQYEEQKKTDGYTMTHGVSRNVSARVFVYDLSRAVPVLIVDGHAGGITERTAFDPYHYPALPDRPGGHGVVEPLAAIASKVLLKVPEPKTAKR